MNRLIILLSTVVIVCAPGLCSAQAHGTVKSATEVTGDASPTADTPLGTLLPTVKDVPEPKKLGLEMEVQFASAFVFRGYNVFQHSSQMNSYLFVAPACTWSIAESGFSVGYWGAYQLVGEDPLGNVDNGSNLEQDLFVSYERRITRRLSMNGMMTLYLFPFATRADAGAQFPTWVEPSVTATYEAGIMRGALFMSYFFGVQSTAAIRDASYLYVNPSLTRTFTVKGRDLEIKLGYGYKQFTGGNDGMSNTHDVTFAAHLTLPFGDFFVKPGVGAAWTNLEAPGKAVVDGFVVWAWVSVGASR